MFKHRVGNNFPHDIDRSPHFLINDACVDEKDLIYANDRWTGGLYILEYTGPIPLR